MEKNVFALERKRLGLTQEQLAKKLNTSRSNVANWENGQNNPSIELMIKCSDIFGCDILYLAGYQNERIKNQDDIPLPEPDDDYINENSKQLSQIEILFNKAKSHLSPDDEETIKFIMNKTIKNYEESKNKNNSG